MNLLTSWLASPPPHAAIEIAPTRVSAATVVRSTSADSGVAVRSHAVEPLPPGAVSASLGAHNIIDRPTVAAAVRAVLGRLDTRVTRVALIIPDLAAKVSLVRFDQVPTRREDLDHLVRWQVRKSAPFAIDDACVSYTAGARGDNGSAEYVVVLARRDVIQEYEQVCADAGVYAGLVDLTTFAVLNLVLASSNVPAADWLAVHMRPEYTSLAIVRGADVVFFRNRPEGDQETLADLVHQTAMYYQDRLSGQGFARVLLGGGGHATGAVDLARRSLQERLGAHVEPMDSTIVAPPSDRIGVTGDLMDVLAPLTGMLLRTRQEAVGA